MNAKWMQRTLVGLTLAAALNSWAADPQISDVMVRQRWPWSRLVDIDYVLSCDSTQSVDILIQAYNGNTAVSLPDNSLSGDRFGVTYGAHHLVWDPTLTSSTNSGVLPNFRVSLTPTDPPVYMIVDLTKATGDAGQIEYVYSGDARLESTGRWTNVWFGVTNDEVYATTKLVLRRVPAGSFGMGSTSSIQTTLTKGYYVGVFEVTQRQWEIISGSKYSYFYTLSTPFYPTRPLEWRGYTHIRGSVSSVPSINWPTTGHVVSSNSFVGLLRTKTGLNGFDLPTEAQWEYSCRAGTTNLFNDGDALSNVSGVNAYTNSWMNLLGRYKYDGGYINGTMDPPQTCTPTNGTAIVGSYLPNGWGLYDTHGNVWEWCLDWYRATPSGGTDPVGGTGSVAERMLRGGGYASTALQCSSPSRTNRDPAASDAYNGFRLVFNLP